MDNIQKAVIRKEKNIAKFVDSKQSSIQKSSIMRDSAMFSCARLGTWKEVKQSDLIEEYKFWRAFFEKEYGENEKVAAHEAVKEEYKADPLNTLDVVPEEAGQHLAE